MPVLASALDTEPYDITYPGDRRVRMTDYFGRPMDTSITGPQSHLVEPVSEQFYSRAHYHVQDQYQIFVDSTGAFGSRELKPPVTLQYADAYTPYGPFHATEGTLRFVTLRNGPDPGSRYVDDPEARAEMRGRSGHQFMLHIEAADRSRGAIEELFDRGDGVRVHRVVLGPGATATGPSPAGSLAQYYVVIGGSFRYDGRDHPWLSHLRVAGDEDPAQITAGDDGLDALVLAFRPTQEPA